MLSGVDSSTILYFVFASALLAGEGNLVVLERDLSELARAEDGFAEVELSEVELTDASRVTSLGVTVTLPMV